MKIILKNFIKSKKLSIHLPAIHCLQIVHLMQQIGIQYHHNHNTSEGYEDFFLIQEDFLQSLLS